MGGRHIFCILMGSRHIFCIFMRGSHIFCIFGKASHFLYFYERTSHFLYSYEKNIFCILTGRRHIFSITKIFIIFFPYQSTFEEETPLFQKRTQFWNMFSDNTFYKKLELHPGIYFSYENCVIFFCDIHLSRTKTQISITQSPFFTE